jgi:hypothetical protein
MSFIISRIKFKKNADVHEWTVCYDTPITNDVIGYLTKEEIQEIVLKISKLN